MQKRRSLTAGLSVVPPDADPGAVQAFVTQDSDRTEAASLPQIEPTAVVSTPAAAAKSPPKARRARRGPLPVGLIPVTVRLKPDVAAALKRASLERQLRGDEPSTQQEIVEQALEPFLRADGFLS